MERGQWDKNKCKKDARAEKSESVWVQSMPLTSEGKKEREGLRLSEICLFWQRTPGQPVSAKL